ncbi:acyltransferase [Segetibacter sp.]|jgi:fucose 4-O-acetylase-like acetyltransferase|uniref:acyltransferase family protein n=1 Tax=Segetibacter sp. TaxID=2231182 RepID=UPI00262EF9B2|nr:acyltransferase [Segetibacter sp.]MCW3081454.1 acyltransferase [Segetibacter sp.]
MNHFLSQKFKFYSFVSISLLLYVHGYNLHETYLTPYSTVQEPLTFTTFIEYFFANGALRFRIPLLFMISGYIFTLHSKRPYAARIKRRFATLIVPFLFWSAVGILITYLWQQSTVTAQAVKDAAIDQLGDNRPYNEIGWLGVLYRWLVKPVSFHLWFIRSLFIYNLLYPVISWFISKAPTIWFALVFLFWHTIFNFSFIEGQGLFFFSLGILINTSNYPIHKKPLWFSDYLSWLFFLGISVIKTFMAFELEPNNPATPLILYALHDTSIGAGILAVWFGADPIVKWCMDKKWFQWVASFSFIIFAFHVPLVHYTTRLAFIYWNHLPNYRLLTYLIVPVFIFFFCVVTGVIFRKVFPKAYRFATGGRGL